MGSSRPFLAVFCFIFVTFARGYRLPASLHPTHYDLDILANLVEPFDFHGVVTIHITVEEPSNNITLHSKNLDIHNKNIELHEFGHGKLLPLKDFKTEPDNDFFIIFPEQELKKGRYNLKISYQGVLETGLDGFYKSSYVDNATGEKKHLGVTQFEAIAARKAFPCFDEPAMKATYNISIGRHQNYTSVSNMPLIKTEKIKEKDDWFRDTFAKSVPMSTYLVAWMVSDFGYKTSEQRNNNVTFRIWSRKDALEQLDFASKTGPRALKFFEDFFNIDYPLPKVDMAAIPDFSAGAMENWGLVTYRESYLLYDPAKSSLYSEESIASVISHELAHQWFGNLVTMDWWTDLWLNEGFATYMATVAVDKLFPEWQVKDEDAVENLMAVFKLDSLKSSHPVSVPIGHPRDIDQIFDTISYKKGSSLIRMMAMFLGEEVLRKGVKNYLIKHQYKNAEQDDLWNALTDEAHKESTMAKDVNVKEIMDTWTVQTGYPVIQVHRNYDQNSAEVSQKRYLHDVQLTKDADSTSWWIPLTYTNQESLEFNNTRPKRWMKKEDRNIEIKDVGSKDQWVIFNIQGAGLYRVNYDEHNWKLLIKTLNSDKFTDISTFNRILLLEDAATFAWTNQLSYDLFFKAIKYLTREKEFLPWDVLLAKIRNIHTLLGRTPTFGDFKKFFQHLLEKPYSVDKFKEFKDRTHNDLKKQVLIAGTACAFNVQECVHDAVKLFHDFRYLNQSVPSNFRKAIFCMGIRHGNVSDWDFLWNVYLNSNNANEKSHVLWTLGCTNEVWLLQRYLSKILEPNSGIRKQDADTVFSAVVGNPAGFYVAKSFLEENIEKLAEYVGKNKKLSRYIVSIGRNLISEKELEAFKNFTNQHQAILLDSKQAVDQTIETAKTNVQWHNLHYKKISELLHQKHF